MNLRRNESGYVLIMVLASVALMALIATTFSRKVDELRAKAGTLQKYAAAKVELNSAVQISIFALATRFPTLASFEGQGHSIAVDGRLYKTKNGAFLRFQDTRGLIPINVTDRGLLSNLLQNADVPQAEVDRFIDQLYDYADTDNFKRLSGAEETQYKALGMAPPRNDWLTSTNELKNIPIWAVNPIVTNKIRPLFSSGREFILNPNTMPIEVLKAMTRNTTEGHFDRFVTLRKSLPFRDARTLEMNIGLKFAGAEYIFHASDTVRLEVWINGLPQAYYITIQLTPGAEAKPWLIESIESSPIKPNLSETFENIEIWPND